MTVTGTILNIHCVKEATGTDVGAVFQPLVEGIAQLEPVLPGDLPVAQAIAAVPGLVQAIDAARSDPDNLFVTTSTEADLDNAIWPLDENDEPTTVDLQAGQSVSPQTTVEFEFSQNISLWDFDDVSDNDLLGSVTMLESEQGSVLTKLASSQVEASAYYITYSVE
jgi:hypothetical protein